MADLRGFAQEMRAAGSAAARNAGQLVQKAALAADQAVVLATPVDTGRARLNWLVGIGTPRRDVIGDVPRGPGSTAATAQLRGSQGAGAASESLSAAQAALIGYRDGDIWLSNNLPYIVPLNDGHSRQAPAGFIQLAIIAALNAIRGMRLLP